VAQNQWYRATLIRCALSIRRAESVDFSSWLDVSLRWFFSPCLGLQIHLYHGINQNANMLQKLFTVSGRCLSLLDGTFVQVNHIEKLQLVINYFESWSSSYLTAQKVLNPRTISVCIVSYNSIQCKWPGGVPAVDTTNGHHQWTSSQQFFLLYNKFITNGQKFFTSQHFDMSRCWALALRCGKFIVELCARPLVVLYNMSVAGVRVVEWCPPISPNPNSPNPLLNDIWYCSTPYFLLLRLLTSMYTFYRAMHVVQSAVLLS